MTEELFILLMINGLAWWHREPWAYVISGFTLLLYGLHYAGAIADITLYLSILLVGLGIYTFFKAAWDRNK